LDRLAERAGERFRSGRGSYVECRLGLAGRDLLLFKPTTYMNLSGQAVVEFAQFYRVEPGEMLVVFDDMDLPLGEIRFRARGSGGNHNGMNHVLQVLGTDEIPRLRLGFHPPVEIPSREWRRLVLGPVPAAAREAVDEMLQRAAEGIGVFLAEGLTTAMNRFNRGAASGAEDAGLADDKSDMNDKDRDKEQDQTDGGCS